MIDLAPVVALPDAIRRAVADDDMDAFRQLVFTGNSGSELSAAAASVLHDGFYVGSIGTARLYQSFVGMAMALKRPRFVREVLGTAGQGLPQAERHRSRRERFQMLCSAAAGDDPYFKSPPIEIEDRLSAAFHEFPDFIAMTVECLPDDDGLQRLRERDAEAAAMISEIEMQLRIRRAEDLHARPPAAPDAAPEITHRGRRHV